MLNIPNFFDLDGLDFSDHFLTDKPAWQPLQDLKSYLNKMELPCLPASLCTGEPLQKTIAYHDGQIISDGLSIQLDDATKEKLTVYKNDQLLPGASVIMAGAVLIGDTINIGRGVLIETGSYLKGPTSIGDCTEVRQGAYVRGYCLAGKRCVIGHTTEIKHSILLNDAKAGHFAYIGDSILGNRVNLGAGTKLANLKFTGGNILIKTSEGFVDSKLRKLGAIIGDDAQTGCNSVTNPGTLLGKRSMLLPNTTAPSGLHNNASIIK